MAVPWLLVRKLDYAGRQVIAYPGRVLYRAPAMVVLETRWERATYRLDYVTLEPGDRWRESFYSDRWYNVFEIHAADGRLKGWYCNVTLPASIEMTEVSARDLALDLWVGPQGETAVLDRDEFAALPLRPDERAAALAALDEMLALVEQRRPPFVPKGSLPSLSNIGSSEIST
jgi:hypothetical protein